MISVKEAQRRILENTFPTPPEIRPLREVTGRILAESLASPYPLPFFDNSAMDGYAVRAEESPASFKITASIPAGTPAGTLRPGETFRIFTGAMIPEGADAVVKQEEVLREGDRIVIKRAIEVGENIRTQGEEIEKGDTLLQAGVQLTPAAIGLLAGVGLKEVSVFSKPRVGIVVTGSEIVAGSNDDELRPGKIFDSNSFSLAAALEELRLMPSFIHYAPDERDSLQRILRDGFSQADFLIVTGGVSVGDFDFVREAAREVGIEEVFWKVAQKPGKPMFFGKRDQTFIFGLPGNPASALVCFYEYVRPVLLRSMGSRTPFLTTLRAHLKEDFRKKAGMTHFLKGRHFADLSVEIVEILENQGSHMMSSFAAANCMVVIPEEKEEMKKGEEVEVHLLPL